MDFTAVETISKMTWLLDVIREDDSIILIQHKSLRTGDSKGIYWLLVTSHLIFILQIIVLRVYMF